MGIDNDRRWICIYRRFDICNAAYNLRRTYPRRKVFDSTRLASQVGIGIHLIMKMHFGKEDLSSRCIQIVYLRKTRELSTCLLRDDIPRRFYSDNDSRSLIRNDWVDTDVRRSDPGTLDGRRTHR